jgi:hypothetical protein
LGRREVIAGAYSIHMEKQNINNPVVGKPANNKATRTSEYRKSANRTAGSIVILT